MKNTDKEKNLKSNQKIHTLQREYNVNDSGLLIRKKIHR